MRPRSFLVLILGALLFLAGTVLLFLWMGGAGRTFLTLGVGIVALSAIFLAVGGLVLGTSPDPLELRRDRRLWKSGPLGRRWLGKRRRLP